MCLTTRVPSLTEYGGTGFAAGYTSDGRRAWRMQGGTAAYYLYDGGTPVVEMAAAGATTAVNTVGTAGLLARQAGASSTLYTFDPRGNVTERLDGTGSVLSRHGFDGYGAEFTTPVTTEPFAYGAQVGYYTDRDTGLLLLTHRYYTRTGAASSPAIRSATRAG